MKRILKNILVKLLLLQTKLALWRFKPKVIAITGSVGKTGTKEAIYTALNLTDKRLRKSPKSFNSDIGLALTVLGLENAWNSLPKWGLNILLGCLVLLGRKRKYPEVLILEVGADRPGDISRLGKLIKPDIVVIVAIPDIPSHVEFFASPDEVADEKFELIHNAKPNAVLIYNADHDLITKRAVKYKGKKISFGTQSAKFDTYLRSCKIKCSDNVPVGMEYVLCSKDGCFPGVLTGNVGLQFIYPIMASVAVGLQFKLSAKQILSAMSEKKPIPGRMRVLPAQSGATIIDDSYNASPASVLAGLRFIENVSCINGRKLVALGDMAELGAFADEGHLTALRNASAIADVVFIKGDNIKKANKTLQLPNIQEYESTDDMLSALQNALQKGDLLYVKGSQSARMEKIVSGLVIHKLRNTDIMVRQEKEWERR